MNILLNLGYWNFRESSWVFKFWMEQYYKMILLWFKDFLFLFQTENLPLTIIVSEQDNNSGKIVYIFKDLLPKFYIILHYKNSYSSLLYTTHVSWTHYPSFQGN